MSSPSTRLGLEGVATSDAVTEYRAAINNHRDTLDVVALYDEGPIGTRPTSSPGTPGQAGRFYKSTDESPNVLYFDYGTGWLVVARTTGALTAHASTHKSSGTDPLYKTGTGSGTTDGSGSLSVTITHGLGTTPSIVNITPTSGLTAHTSYAVEAKSSTQFTVHFITGVATAGVGFDWEAKL
jgi:hypothetical protein